MKPRIIQIEAPTSPIYATFRTGQYDYVEIVQLWALVADEDGKTSVKGMSGEGVLRFCEDSKDFAGYATKSSDPDSSLLKCQKCRGGCSVA